MVDNLLDSEDLFMLLGLAYNLHPGVKLSAHYHQVLGLGQGVDGISSTEWTATLCCALILKTCRC